MRQDLGRGFRSIVSAAALAAATTLWAQTGPALNLFNGTSLLGWNAHGQWTGTGGLLATNTSGERYVLTAVPFGDFNLQFEYSQVVPLETKLRIWASRENGGGLSIDLDPTSAKSGVGGIETLAKSSLTTVSPGWHRVQVDAAAGTVTVRIDDLPAGKASGLGVRAGYLGFATSLNGQLQVRNVRLRPLGLNSAFNGSDLGGWKSVARQPDAKGGITHSAAKVMSFGMAGGSTKPHEAKWSVRNGAIHGESGPGGLENSTPMEDGVIQLTSALHGDIKPENFAALSLRSAVGQLGSGYPVGIASFAGSIDKLAKSTIGKANTPIEQTIVIAGRTVAIWTGGNLANVYTDSRPESGNAAQGSKIQAGVSTLLLGDGNTQMDVSRISFAALQKPYGVAAKAAPPPLAPVPTVPASNAGGGSVAPSGGSAAEQLIVQQQKDAARKDAEEQSTKARVSSLMSQALSASDPQQQQNLYGQVIQLDPSNPNAMQGYKEAQAKVAAQHNAEAQSASRQMADQDRDQQTNSALVTAQGAFLSGHLSEASNALSVAERLSPGNPLVRELRQRIGSAQSLRSRLFLLGGGVGFVALLSALLLWIRRKRTQRFPALEITAGIDKGKIYPIEKDQTRIGAVPQDGGQKNDIVVRDVEHAVSRFHCELIRKNGQIFIQDLNSSNGTRLNGKRLQPGTPELVRKGSTIKLAETVELRLGYSRARKSA